MTEHDERIAESERLLRRLDQIEQTARRVTPTDVGKWSQAVGKPSPADGVVIAPADLAWLLAVARTCKP